MGMVEAPQGFLSAIENHGPEAALVEETAKIPIILGASETLYVNSPLCVVHGPALPESSLLLVGERSPDQECSGPSIASSHCQIANS